MVPTPSNSDTLTFTLASALAPRVVHKLNVARSYLLTSAADGLPAGHYAARVWPALAHFDTLLCTVYEVRACDYVTGKLGSKADVAAAMPSSFLFIPARSARVSHNDAGVFCASLRDPSVSLRSTHPQTAAMLSDSGVNLIHTNGTFSLHAMQGVVTTVTVSALPERTHRALTAL